MVFISSIEDYGTLLDGNNSSLGFSVVFCDLEFFRVCNGIVGMLWDDMALSFW